MKIPQKMVTHSFVYYEYLEENRDHEPIYKKPLTIKGCRVDYDGKISRNRQENKDEGKCIIYCYKSNTAPFLAFKEKSKIEINGIEKVIEKVIPVMDFFGLGVFAYELEVV